jgi:hypothetical protein
MLLSAFVINLMTILCCWSYKYDLMIMLDWSNVTAIFCSRLQFLHTLKNCLYRLHLDKFMLICGTISLKVVTLYNSEILYFSISETDLSSNFLIWSVTIPYLFTSGLFPWLGLPGPLLLDAHWSTFCRFLMNYESCLVSPYLVITKYWSGSLGEFDFKIYIELCGI